MQESESLARIIEEQRSRMLIQKQKLEQQTMRRIYFMGETPAEIEATKEIRRSDPKRYGVKRL